MIHWVTSRDHIAAGSRTENSCYQNYARDEFDNRGREASGVVARADGNSGSKSALDDDLMDVSLDRLPSEDGLSLSRLDAGDGSSETPSTAGLSGKTAQYTESLPTRPPNAVMPPSSSSR